MITVRLTRGHSSDQGTFGRIEAPGFSAYTGEQPWRDNAARVSCIPEGDYPVIWTLSPRLRRDTYRLQNVPGRSGVLIHSANLMGDASAGWVSQLQGCIALGEVLGSIRGQAALLRSKPAVRRFESAMNRQPFLLEIRNA